MRQWTPDVRACRVWSSTGWISPYNADKLIGGVLGYLDYSGSSMVHALGGMAALIAVFVLGPRHGRFGIDGEVVELEGTVVRIPLPHPSTLICLGEYGAGAYCCPQCWESCPVQPHDRWLQET